MSSATLRWWLLGSVLLALALAPLLARGDAASRKQQADNAQEIKAMSDSEWARVERNFEAFKQLPPNEQQQVLTFHEQLAPAPEQKAALKSYVSWLATLEPYQRDRLSQVDSTSERIALIKTIIKEQQERSVDRAIPYEIARIPAPVLSSDDLERVMSEIEQLSRSSLGQKLEALKPLTGVRRYYELLKMLANASTNSELDPIFQKPPPVFARVAEKIDQLVEDSEMRKFFQRENDRDSADRRLAGVLMKSMLIELFKSTEGRKPSSGELAQFFGNLPEHEQDQLLNLEAADFQSDLTKQLRAAEGDVSLVDIRELFISREMLGHMQNRFGRGRDNEGGRPDSSFRPRGPRARNGENGDNGDGRRPPEGRPPFRPGDGPPPRRPDVDLK